MFPANVVTPATFTLSKFVCPSTSMSPAKSILPFAIISFANVETPTMFKPPPSTLIPPALTSTPVLAVTIPSESIFVTSS